MPHSIQDILRKATKQFLSLNLVINELSTATHDFNKRGPIGKTLMGARVLSILGTHFLSDKREREQLRDQGYKEVYPSLGHFIASELESITPVSELCISKSLHLTSKIWEMNGQKIIIDFYEGRYSNGPFTLDGNTEIIEDLLRSIIWEQKGLELFWDCRITGLNWKPEYTFTPLSSPPTYIGSISAAKHAKRIRDREGIPTTLLIMGPSGVGKSLLARHIAREVAEFDQGRLLKISKSVLKQDTIPRIVGLIKCLKPDVTLFDDLTLKDEDLLELLEALRVEGCVSIITKMISSNGKEAHIANGMRPGRIDDVIVLDYQDKNGRRALLHYYFEETSQDIDESVLEAIVEKTERWSNAHLVELVQRCKAYGIDSWTQEVISIESLATLAGWHSKPQEDITDTKINCPPK